MYENVAAANERYESRRTITSKIMKTRCVVLLFYCIVCIVQWDSLEATRQRILQRQGMESLTSTRFHQTHVRLKEMERDDML